MSDEIVTGRTLPISVVIPAYNSERFVGAAIASVLAQSRVPAEILVIDDGSSDATAQRAQAAGARVITQANRGPASARNAGIREARQPWVAFLDADDAWTPDKLDRQWAAHERCPHVPILISDYALVQNGRVLSKSLFALMPHYLESKREAVGHDAVLIGRDAMLRVTVRKSIVSTSTLLADREWLVENALLYNEKLPSGRDFLIAEDFEWLLRALRHGDVLAIERSLACYARHDENRSSARGRQAYGEVVLGESIASAPAAYAAGAVAEFRRTRPATLRRAGLEYLRQADYANARKILARALRARPSFSSAALLGLATAGDWRLGHLAIAGARALWRRRNKYGAAPTVQ